MNIIPTGATLGATIEGVDLNDALDRATFAAVLRALGEYGALRFPGQRLDPARQMAFSQRFGSLEINVAGAFQEPGHPEIMILSNIKDANGRPLGARDAKRARRAASAGVSRSPARRAAARKTRPANTLS